LPFKYEFSEELEETLEKLFKRDRQRYEITLKKIEEITQRDGNTIDYYKNLRQDLKKYKRVHIDKSFVLIFRVFRNEKIILFDKLQHHDDIYKR